MRCVYSLARPRVTDMVMGFDRSQPPGVAIGKLVASNSGIADITQQQRLAGEIAAAVSQAINQHVPPQAR